MSDLYAPFVRQSNSVIFMDERSSELTKYEANIFLATKISFRNEIAQLCERMDADVDMVKRRIGSDDKIGKRFLFPGVGYCGSCFPKDVQVLIMSSDDVKYDFEILKEVEKVKANQKLHLVEKIKAYYNGNLAKHFVLWGLAFKPNTDDIREAPALSIINALTSADATITASDSEAMLNVKGQIGDKIQYAANQYEALQNSAAPIIAREWSEFRTPDFERMEKEIKHKIIFDGRNFFDVYKMRELGYKYESIGRKLIFLN
jgi:UDPglucose 6-dehydrogenase